MTSNPRREEEALAVALMRRRVTKELEPLGLALRVLSNFAEPIVAPPQDSLQLSDRRRALISAKLDKIKDHLFVG